MIIIPNFDMSNINKVLLILSLLGEIAKITHYFIQNWYIYPDNGTKSYLEVFYEGIFGTIMSGILVLIFSFVQCSEQSHDYFFCFPPEKMTHFGYITLYSQLCFFGTIFLNKLCFSEAMPSPLGKVAERKRGRKREIPFCRGADGCPKLFHPLPPPLGGTFPKGEGFGWQM